jgi:UDP-N-acetylmuramate--alanine ligase
MEMDETLRVHFVGIGGSGLSAMARVLLERGVRVSGSDRQDTSQLQSLKAAGAAVYVGHKAENVEGAGLLVRSSAVREDNPEVEEARQRGIPVLKRADFLDHLTEGYRTIAAAGTHGKTTTTAMIAWMLVKLEKDPTFIVGGTVRGLDTNARAGKGPDFVIEADEYDGMFLGLHPWLAVVTNMEHDHPDCYPTMDDYRHAFAAFAHRVETGGELLVCLDDPGARELSTLAKEAGKTVLTYGLDSQADYRAVEWSPNSRGGFSFKLERAAVRQMNGQGHISISLQVPGLHNVLNALAALAVADRLELPLRMAASALESFPGTGRRFELVGEPQGIAVVDDYAHHPSEIRATLAAARSRYPGRRVWVVWQPHTYSRTRQLLAEYGKVFADADQVIVSEVYAAREAPPQDGFSGEDAARAIQHEQVQFIPEIDQISAYLLKSLRPGDVLLVLSAGDADKVSASVVSGLSQRSFNDA